MNIMEAHMKARLEVAKQYVMRSWACYCSSYDGNIHQEFKDQCDYAKIMGNNISKDSLQAQHYPVLNIVEGP